jgi:hypothetical protein
MAQPKGLFFGQMQDWQRSAHFSNLKNSLMAGKKNAPVLAGHF